MPHISAVPAVPDPHSAAVAAVAGDIAAAGGSGLVALAAFDRADSLAAVAPPGATGSATVACSVAYQPACLAHRAMRRIDRAACFVRFACLVVGGSEPVA